MIATVTRVAIGHPLNTAAFREYVDEKDEQIATQREAKRLKRKGIQVGDIIIVNGKRRRVAYVHADRSVQWTEAGSHHIGSDGYADMSGGLESGLPSDEITATDEIAPARFWFFHHGFAGAHRGVQADIQTRVWLHTPKDGKPVLSGHERCAAMGITAY